MATMTSLLLANPNLPSDGFADSSFSDKGITAPGEPTIVAGFRMEGSPEFDVVFGDTAQFRAHIDRFYVLHENMTAARSTFNQHVQAALIVLDAKRKGACPVADLAALYYRAKITGDSYRKNGAEFESQFFVIRQLDELGETTGLTPDYRWRVNKVRGLYRQALVDYKEMRIAFLTQLGTELNGRGCKTSKLLTAGMLAPDPDFDAIASLAAEKQKKKKYRFRWNETERKVVEATTATFFVDNSECNAPVSVYIDGTLLGQVKSASKSAFQALSGRHTMCLITDKSAKQCGEPGTVRTSYIHNGWSITLRCQGTSASK